MKLEKNPYVGVDTVLLPVFLSLRGFFSVFADLAILFWREREKRATKTSRKLKWREEEKRVNNSAKIFIPALSDLIF